MMLAGCRFSVTMPGRAGLGMLLLVALHTPAIPQTAPMPRSAPEIYATLGGSVARVEFDGELFNGERESGAGTGFVVARSGLLVTCKHVVPVITNYRSVGLWIRLGSRAAPRIAAEILWSAPDLDLIVLKTDTLSAPALPLGQAALPGSDIVVLGFPVNLDLNITKGIVSGIEGPHRHVMDAVINPGNSGGPVIGSDGRAIGVAWGGALKWRAGAEEVPIEGVKFFIPIAQVLAALPEDIRGQLPTSNIWSNKDGSKPPQVLRRAVTVDFVKDDHPVVFAAHRRDYERRFEADRGYRIVKVNVSETSRNHVPKFEVIIAPDGRSATAKAEIESGPLVDQWRGWLLATIELEQVPQ